MRTNEEFWAVLSGLLTVSVFVLAAAVGMNLLGFDEWSGILTLTTLVAVTLPVLSWLARNEGDQDLMRLLVWGMLATVVGVLFRSLVSSLLYGGVGDAGVY